MNWGEYWDTRTAQIAKRSIHRALREQRAKVVGLCWCRMPFWRDGRVG
jgi:hypothetical protein